MQREGLSPRSVTFTCSLKACASVHALERGEEIHERITKERLLETDIVLGSALVNMYARCGALIKARQVLEVLPARNPISWNTLISGYIENGEYRLALECLEGMKKDGLSPNAVTFINLLKACAKVGDLDKGSILHNEISKSNLLKDGIALGNALVDMYVKCGALAKAKEVLKGLPKRNVISWSALIAGYAQQGEGEQALNCYEQMQSEGISPNRVTYLCILKACGCVGATYKGRDVHDEVSKQGLIKDDIVLGTAIVDMYAKCGALQKAEQVLKELPTRDVISWNALMTGYVQRGNAGQALRSFGLMQQDGIRPDSTTFLNVLTACSHLGLVDQAHMYIMDMDTKYGLKPNFEHFTCIVDLFGRVGKLEKAKEVLKKVTVPKVGLWLALLSACLKWGDVNIGRWAFEHAVHADKTDAGVYVLMAKIYYAAGMQEEVEAIEALQLENKSLIDLT
ncbi:hypothetical protein KP509_02G109100 [Ceratopteris richardii]|nr:hypothetical protein KP509_02G109100 [Ceratopteris richardii]